MRVLERDEYGYHRIETVFQTISLHDTLLFEPLGRGRVEVMSDAAPAGAANIAHRAALAILPTGKGVRVTIRKRIPMGAGLGGGSSNAAVTLLALNSLYRVNSSMAQLARIAASLGADVPFFLVGGTAAGLHYGEEIFPLADAPASAVTLLYPGVHVSTAEAYANLKLTKIKPDVTIQNFCYSLLNNRVDLLEAAMGNDFERSVCQDGRIASARRFLKRQGFGAHLSGSGSVLFALGEPEFKLRPGDGWKIWRSRFLSRSRYRKRLGGSLQWPDR